MRTLLLALALLLAPAIGSAQVYVRPYVRKDGTTVQGHWRSKPDSNPYNNYGFPGNVNPYTGRVAPGNADSYLRNYDQHRGLGSSGLWKDDE